MPKIVCVKCECELMTSTIGTIVVETACFGPYKVWNADTLKCPGCGIEVVAGFANCPIRDDHYSSDFEEWLSELTSKSRNVVYDNEFPSRKAATQNCICTQLTALEPVANPDCPLHGKMQKE